MSLPLATTGRMALTSKLQGIGTMDGTTRSGQGAA